MICWINPFTGLAGDMLLAALIDAGAPLDRVRASIAATGLTGWDLTADRVTDHGLTATSVHVRVTDPHTERRAAEVIALASRAAPDPVAALAVGALTAVAEAEGRLHGADPGTVHLHELGGHDTLVDVVGTAAALHALGVTDVVSAPLPLGPGRIDAAHGVLPCPAPATLALLAGAVVTGTDLPGETVTPTAAALLHATRARYGPPPPMSLGRTGYGAGTRRLPDRPNVTAVTLGEAAHAGDQDVVVLETNLDDVTGEVLGHTISRALAAGALDAWATPAVMKKGRPAQILHVLTTPEHEQALRHLVLAETGTLGVRRLTATRTVLPRRFETVDVDGHPVRIKHGPHRAKPEHDDLVAAANRLGLPLREVADRALRIGGQPEQPQSKEADGD
ncbi:nickel pincer cofactor biosynthesis protein LarC [Streptomyces roseirectus]|uniref:Pyridinium-3,5-bisthiocarboxylic acid mononucleotide nickel insertion protein n=1 Tax=Streptomyces roseirectus TaxID=2768066 RepID=A0A7H0IRA1_9ACTN|nr:nickel pincer cofactor biosynthesis protein LarC [Streptomyces roseirectus]QNP75317.1 nickel pincer cofactor biosynthesis protein LarC [Streptomyces roseirectus]